MKRILMAIMAAVMALPVTGQDNKALSDDYARRYDLLVSKLGHAGVGIETLLENWEKIDPDNEKMQVARYSYYLAKSQTVEVVPKPRTRFLGNKPLFSLKDSTGVSVSYFEETMYNDSLYSIAIRSLDKVMRQHPDNLSYHFTKAATLIAYEKESPDMALSFMENLIDRYYSDKTRKWTYPGVENVDETFFKDAMQEYCYTFFTIGSVTSYEAFRTIAEKMLAIYPKDVVFLSDLGTYYFVALNDYKEALKYYNKVLKIKPDDYTAIKNCVLLARRQKNVRLEKKYLPMMVKYGPENDRITARARLDALK